MSTIQLSLAEVETEEVLASWRFLNPTTHEGLIIFSAIGLVTLLVVLTVMFLRKQRHRRRGHHHASRPAAKPIDATEASLDEESPALPEKPRRRRRRTGRIHRPRNPTLAETGGLPPIRPEDSTEP